MTTEREHYQRQFSRHAERWVAEELGRRGHAVDWIGENNEFDLSIDGKARVEVKAATCSPGSRRGRRWQFSLRRHGLPVDEDLVVLVCFGDDLEVLATFVIPGAEVPENLTKIDITSHPARYRGKWTVYRDAWHLVDHVLEQLPDEQLVIDTLFIPEMSEIPF